MWLLLHQEGLGCGNKAEPCYWEGEGKDLGVEPLAEPCYWEREGKHAVNKRCSPSFYHQQQ